MDRLPNIPIGKRIIDLRQKRSYTQQQLADAAGLSVSLIRKLEQGARQTAEIATLVAISNALDVPLIDLLGKEKGLLADAQDSEVLQIRRAILGLGPAIPAEPPTIEQLRASLLDLWHLYWVGRYAALARELPDRLAQARAAVHAASRPADTRAANSVLAEVLQITAALLAHLAYEDLAHLALSLAQTAAETAEDTLLVASQQATTVWVLTRQGLWPDAETLAVSSAAAVEPSKLSQATAEQLAVWGELLRYGVTALGRSGRRSEAEELLGLVTAAASAMAGRKVERTGVVSFGPTIAAMSAVLLDANDRPREALAKAAQLTDISTAPVAIQARYLLGVGYAQMMAGQLQDSVDTLRRVDSFAGEMMRHQMIAKTTVQELRSARGHRRLVGLKSLVRHMGVSG